MSLEDSKHIYNVFLFERYGWTLEQLMFVNFNNNNEYLLRIKKLLEDYNIKHEDKFLVNENSPKIQLLLKNGTILKCNSVSELYYKLKDRIILIREQKLKRILNEN